MKKQLLSKFGIGLFRTAFLGGLIALIIPKSAFGQSTNGFDYKTVSSGNWENPLVWNRFDSNLAIPGWVPIAANEIPDASAGVLTISHNVSINSLISADQILIDQLGSLELNNNLNIPNNGEIGIDIHGKINTKSHVVGGSGELFLQSSGILEIGSPDGISIDGMSGSLQLAGTEFFPGATYVFNGNSLQNTGNGLPSGANLVINNPSGVILSKATDVANLSLTQGKLITSDLNLITVAVGGTATSTSPTSFVQGPLARKIAGAGTLDFPVGAGASKRPLTFEIGSTSGSAEHIIVATQNENAYNPVNTTLPAGITHISTVRSYRLTKRSSGTVNGNITLSFGSDDGVTDLNTLTILNYINASAAPVDLGTTVEAKTNGTINNGTVSGGGIQLTDPNPSSDLVLASKNGSTNPLPVELIAFKAKAYNNEVLLNWATASEKNADRFEIERSFNGFAFEKIGVLNAAGNSQQEKRYAFTDKNSGANMVYYRLKQIDFDGSYAFSEIVKVQLKKAEPSFTVYPNPANEQITIVVNEPGVVRISNVLGQVVLENKISKGETQTLNIANLKAGVYQISQKSAAGTSVQKFLKN